MVKELLLAYPMLGILIPVGVAACMLWGAMLIEWLKEQ